MKILLLDGNSLINRAFYALPVLTNNFGEYTNGVYGFLSIFFKLYETERPDYLCVAFDLPSPTFRHKLFDGYKGTRKEMPSELVPQLPLLKSLLDKMNIAKTELAGYEADDILGTLASYGKNQGMDVVVVSGDRDMLQLADHRVKIVIPVTKGGKTDTESYFYKDVCEKKGVTPAGFIDMKALMGDKSDNIPGVEGIGEKTALKILQEFGSLEEALNRCNEVTPKRIGEKLAANKETALLSKTLATIDTNVPLQVNLEAMKVVDIFTPAAFDEIKRLGFKSLFGKFGGSAKDSLNRQSTAVLQGEALFQEVETDDNPFGDETEALSEPQPSTENESKIIEIKTPDELQSFLNDISSAAAVAFHFTDENSLAVSTEGVDGYIRFSKEVSPEQLASFFSSDVPKLTLDSKHQRKLLRLHGLSAENIIFDAVLGSYLIDSSKPTYEYNDIALDFLGLSYPSKEEIFGKGKRDSRQATQDELMEYFWLHSRTVYKAYPVIMSLLKENNMLELYNSIELPLAKVLEDMEHYGIGVDPTELINFGQRLSGLIDKLTAEITDLAGEEFNINSPIQLGTILFEKLGLKGTKKTKTGYSTSAEVLEKLADKHPIIKKIMDYRTYTKLKSTYVEGLLTVLDKGRIYSTFNQTITTTGRISSSDPNLQNIPIRLDIGRQLRKAFVPREGFVFLDADYSQIELRVLAHMSGDEILINAFKNNQDIHRLTAAQVLNKPLDQVTDIERRSAKAVNFGIIYGISAFSLGEDIGISKKQAEGYIENYFASYPGIKACLDQMVANAKETGYATTLFNRRRKIPELYSGNFNTRTFGERVAMNMPIQGTAADIIKIAMIRVYQRLKQEGLESRLILQVHDELLLEVKLEEKDTATKILREEMESAAELKVPLFTDIHFGDNWYEAK